MGEAAFDWEVLWRGPKEQLCEMEAFYQNKFKVFNPEFGYNKNKAMPINNCNPVDPLVRFHGRYKGKETVVISKRVRAEDQEAIRKALDSVYVDGRLEGYLMKGRVEGGSIDKLKSDNAALLNNVDQLTKELDYWKQRFEKAVNATEHQMAIYWKDRALKAEGALKKGEFDQT